MDFPIHLPNQLRQHLRALRNERGLTQAALGKLLGIGQARVAEIESNPGVVSVDQLMKMLSALNALLVLRDEPADRRRAAPALDAKVSPALAGSPRRKPDKDTRRAVVRSKKGSW